MKREAPLYRTRLARRRTFLGGSSLWLGADHLLFVRSWRFQEEYRRFYFREIRAITVQDLSASSILQWWDLVAAVVALLLFMFAVHGWPSGITVGTFVLLYVIGMLRRPTCKCQLYTAVSQEWLRPLTRVKRAQRFLNELQPLIEQAQADLPPLSLEQLQLTDITEGARATVPAALPRLQPRALALYAVLFTLLPLDAAVNLYSAHAPQTWLAVAVIAVLLAETGAAALTFVQTGTSAHPRFRGIVIGILIFLYTRYMATYIGVVVANAIQRPGTKPIDILALFRNQYPQAISVNEALAAVAFVLAVAGFAILWLEQQRYAPADVS